MSTLTPSPPTIWFGPPAAPPLSAGPVVVQNGHLAIAGQRATFFGVNFDFTAILSLLNPKQNAAGVTVMELDPNQEAVFTAQLDNLVACGIRAVRIHGLDCEGQPNLFGAPGETVTTTRQFSPAALSALDWFLSQLETRNIRYVLDLHYTRQLMPADQPPWACPLFTECLTGSYVGAPLGLMDPWVFYDTGLQQLQYEFDGMLLGHVNQFTGGKIGESNGLLAVVLENEQSLAKVPSWGYGAHPQLNTAFNADFANWCTNNGIIVAKAGDAEHAEYAAWKETQVFGARTANVRTLTSALVIAGNYFGNGPYSMLVSLAAVGDGMDAHFYSYYAATEQIANGGPGNGFLCGQAAAPGAASSARSRFAAVLAGCSCQEPGGQGLPLFVTEWAPVPQYMVDGEFEQDPPAERSLVLPAFVQVAIAQDADATFLYSYAHNVVFTEESPYQSVSVYDFRFDPVLLKGMPSQAAAFRDLSLRPTTSVTVTPTNGVYGAMVTNTAGQSVYEQYGPYTDPALYAVSAGHKVLISVALTETFGADQVPVSLTPTETIGTDNVPMSVAPTGTIGTDEVQVPA